MQIFQNISNTIRTILQIVGVALFTIIISNLLFLLQKMILSINFFISSKNTINKFSFP